MSSKYDIENELRVRQLLEENTNWAFEFTKNDKYEVDMQLFDWGDPPIDAESRSLVGYVEIEVASAASDWDSGAFPDHWPEVSFLKRKIRDWDYARGNWAQLKSHARKTLYLKFNHELDNCFVAPVERIYHDHQWERVRGRNSKPCREEEVYCLHPSHDSIRWGIRDSIEFIEDYFDALDGDQHSLSSFVSTGGQADD